VMRRLRSSTRAVRGGCWAGVANILNQLTAKLHTTGQVDAALPAGIAAVERVMVRVDDAIAEVSAVVTGGGRR
jgi:hypothetical protein